MITQPSAGFKPRGSVASVEVLPVASVASCQLGIGIGNILTLATLPCHQRVIGQKPLHAAARDRQVPMSGFMSQKANPEPLPRLSRS
jgi:hypothetical protein